MWMNRWEQCLCSDQRTQTTVTFFHKKSTENNEPITRLVGDRFERSIINQFIDEHPHIHNRCCVSVILRGSSDPPPHTPVILPRCWWEISSSVLDGSVVRKWLWKLLPLSQLWSWLRGNSRHLKSSYCSCPQLETCVRQSEKKAFE